MTSAMIGGSRAGRSKDQHSPMTSLSPRPWTSRRIIFLGIVGAILAIPTAAILQVLFLEIWPEAAEE